MTVLYNPILLEDKELRAQFVVRGAILERLADSLREARPGHSLVVGARGMGKTTLLRRLRLEIREDPELQRRWIPLSFPEEQYNVARLPDVWANCVDALADWYESTGRADDAERLDAALAADPRGALASLLAAAAAERRGLVLLIDNLDLVLGRLGEADQWELRRVLGDTPALVLVGASANLADESAEYGKPFYEFLHPISLAALAVSEMRALLQVLARQAAAVRAVSEIGDGRLRTLHALTGGNPRTIGLLFEVLVQDGHGDAETQLNRLLDRVTPLYKARFEALPDQLQLVLDAVALAWDPATAATIAEATGLAVNLASAQLARLVELGQVAKVPLPGTRKLGFQVAERFFNMWYLMRASRRLRRRLGHLVRFMEMLWTPEDRRLIAGLFARDGAELGAILALAQTARAEEDPAMAAALSRALARTEGSAELLREKLVEMIEPGPCGLFVREAVDREAWRRGVRGALEARAEELAAMGLTLDEAERLVRLVRSLTGWAWDPGRDLAQLGEWGTRVEELRRSYVGLAGPLITDALWAAAASPGWSGPADARGRAAALFERPSAWLEIALDYLEAPSDAHDLSRRVAPDVIRAAAAESLARRDADGLGYLWWRTAADEPLVSWLWAVRAECLDPADWVVAMRGHIRAGDTGGAVRSARQLLATNPENADGWEALGLLTEDDAEAAEAVARGLFLRPDSPVLLPRAVELALARGDHEAAGTHAARLVGVPLVGPLLRKLAPTFLLHPRERGVRLVRDALAQTEPDDRSRAALSGALVLLGTPRPEAMRLGLKGLRGAARARREAELTREFDDGQYLVRVDAPLAWRRARLSEIAASRSAAAIQRSALQLALLAAGGHAAEAIDWITRNSRAEVLAPLLHALRILHAGDRELLLGLSPEMRAPADGVLAWIDALARAGGVLFTPSEPFNEAWSAERTRMEAAFGRDGD